MESNRRMNHFSHEEHPLVLVQVETQRERKIECYGCLKSISTSEMAYNCGECNLYLHKVCAEQPRQIMHRHHPQHPLTLLAKPNYECWCDICDLGPWKGFTYNCSECKFDVHIECVLEKKLGDTINHFSHEEHPLVLANVQVLRNKAMEEGSGNEMECRGCLRPILSSLEMVYSCGECNLYLHKVCAEQPKKMTGHRFHPQHQLVLSAKRIYTESWCDFCGVRDWKGFTYHCEECKFDMDIGCALESEVGDHTDNTINHFSHREHPLVFVNVEAQRKKALAADSDKEVECYGCLKPIGPSEMTYSCTKCNLYLHKVCAEQPRVITGHPFHPQHSLILLTKPNYKSAECWCAFCSLRNWKGFTYHCKECKVDMDIGCSLESDQVGEMGDTIYHFSHREHPLVRVDVEVHRTKGTAMNSGEKFECYVCLKLIWPSEMAYKCGDCNLYLHKVCAEQPRIMTGHPFHPQHPLILTAKPNYTDKKCWCNVCNLANWKGFTYNCKQCEFDVHIDCALELFFERETSKRLEHPSHKHPLMLLRRPATLECDGCLTKMEDKVYICTACPNFWLHESCALLPSTIPPGKDHDHSLTLAFEVPTRYREYKFKCEVCHKSLNPSSWVYYCGPCRHFVHIKCMTFDPTPIDSLARDDGHEDDLVGLVRLPAVDAPAQLIQPFIEKFGTGLVETLDTVQALPPEALEHFSHEHPLQLCDYSRHRNDEKVDLICDACVSPIVSTTPWYHHCATCNFTLHVACSRLPAVLDQHPLHPIHGHQLKLLSGNQCYYTVQCDICKDPTNGFYYSCQNCEFLVDVKCASLPSTILHQFHPHPLLLQHFKYSTLCDACNCSLSDNFLFCCEACGFRVSYGCALSPPTVKNKWEKLHEMKLSCPPYFDYPDDFTCDKCEGEDDIHPKSWMYRCSNTSGKKCLNHFHLNCVYEDGCARNIKMGRRVESASKHPHRLTFVPRGRRMRSCHNCNQRADRNIWAFECVPCDFHLCLLCFFF